MIVHNGCKYMVPALSQTNSSTKIYWQQAPVYVSGGHKAYSYFSRHSSHIICWHKLGWVSQYLGANWWDTNVVKRLKFNLWHLFSPASCFVAKGDSSAVARALHKPTCSSQVLWTDIWSQLLLNYGKNAMQMIPSMWIHTSLTCAINGRMQLQKYR